MTIEIYDKKKVEAHLASSGDYFDRKNAGKKAETHLNQLGTYFDSNPLALIESSYVRLKKRQISSAEVDDFRKKLQAAYKQAKVMSLDKITQFYHQRGLKVNTET